jgi:acetolactate decarboxylase
MRLTALLTALPLPIAGLLLAGCAGAPVERPSDGTVAWAGSQRQAVHAGDVGPKVRLSELAARPHLYAIGPLEGLTGEITVLDGNAAITTVVNGNVRTGNSLDHGAAFLVWTYAAAWSTTPLPADARTMEQLEATLPATARSAGFDGTAPVAFRIEGTVETLNYHVLNRAAGTPLTAEAHEASKAHFALTGRRVHLVGFYSTQHRGVFTPGTSNIHLHVVSDDGLLAGHVESFTLAPGATLLFPASAEPKRGAAVGGKP